MSSKSFRSQFAVLAASVLVLACSLSGAPQTPAPLPTSVPPAPQATLPPAAPATLPAAGLTPPAAVQEGQLTVESGPARIENGFLKVAGRVQNNGQQILTGATVSFVFYDKSNAPITLTDLLGSTNTRVQLTSGPVAPGEYGYYMLVHNLKGRPLPVDHQAVSAVGRWAASGPTVELAGVSVGSLSADPIAVTGTAKNTGTLDCASPDVVVIGFAQDGSVYEVDGSPLNDSAGNILSVLKPGDSAPFKAYVGNTDGKVTKVIEASHCVAD
jgi:hypothetical protein